MFLFFSSDTPILYRKNVSGRPSVCPPTLSRPSVHPSVHALLPFHFSCRPYFLFHAIKESGPLLRQIERSNVSALFPPIPSDVYIIHKNLYRLFYICSGLKQGGSWQDHVCNLISFFKLYSYLFFSLLFRF